MINIKIAEYKLFDYELAYLKQEIQHFGGRIKGKIQRGAIIKVDGLSRKNALNLTYIQGILDNDKLIFSNQYRRESCNGFKKGQSTRYGPHSLHEYKGRFNPHHPRSLILRTFNDTKMTILDPFMGSGTTLVEARGLGFSPIGVELNIFASLIANAKKYYEEIKEIPNIKVKNKKVNYFNDVDSEYLSRWFPKEQLLDLGNILSEIAKLSEKEKLLMQIILSDLLRDHSLQDPKDLRIRRRDMVPESMNLLRSFYASLEKHRARHKQWINEFGNNKKATYPIHGDSTKLSQFLAKKVDGTVSSPPYASALPYIDTYRLSMVALGLISHKDILKNEKELIGSRDVSRNDEESFSERIIDLPKNVKKIIVHIKTQIGSDDTAGFRKKAVPYSLANYTILMKRVLQELYIVEKKGGINLWVIGPNKVKLNSEWYNIDTPSIIGSLADNIGFKNIEIIPVQAYSRYNMHSKNSISSESILKFKK